MAATPKDSTPARVSPYGPASAENPAIVSAATPYRLADVPPIEVGVVPHPPVEAGARVVPPPPVVGSQTWYQSPAPMPRTPVMSPMPPMPAMPAKRTSKLSVASLVLGILGSLLLQGTGGLPFSLAAIIFGHVAYPRETTHGRSLAGLIMGYLGLVVVLLRAFSVF